ncbi:hypothetical protein SBRCBS47491_001456 [Sporothrix bragantina]|uniref:Pyridoxamine 5'-phosphate oxidase Alr4036 family FMN-binding domain-containing protein n=1 Tax=Sporothrix bragantina TaxID=671064 RepID=A0ABP0AYY4_9PEZI
MLIRTPQPASVPAALAAPAAGAAAPWRDQFIQQLSQMSMPLCAVSTVHPPLQKSALPTPRVRNCVCRGLWASLPNNARNPAPRNPAIYESDLPVFTTDVRMEKAWEISASGGPIEAVWWAADAGTQWRVRGRAWLLGPEAETPAGEEARTAIQKHMRWIPGSAAGSTGRTPTAATTSPLEASTGWSWSREITAHFGNLSPGMRGSFRNPAPGQPRPARGKEGNSSPGEGLGDPVDNDHLDDPEARANFRVCVIVPEEVDQCDLSKGDDPRRWLYTYVGEGDEDKHGDEEDRAAKVKDADEIINGWAKKEIWP